MKDNVRQWLIWRNEWLESWKDGRITTIISPSGKYDPVVKMTANVLGVHSVGPICCTAAVGRHEVPESRDE